MKVLRLWPEIYLKDQWLHHIVSLYLLSSCPHSNSDFCHLSFHAKRELSPKYLTTFFIYKFWLNLNKTINVISLFILCQCGYGFVLLFVCSFVLFTSGHHYHTCYNNWITLPYVTLRYLSARKRFPYKNLNIGSRHKTTFSSQILFSGHSIQNSLYQTLLNKEKKFQNILPRWKSISQYVDFTIMLTVFLLGRWDLENYWSLLLFPSIGQVTGCWTMILLVLLLSACPSVLGTRSSGESPDGGGTCEGTPTLKSVKRVVSSQVGEQ